jgi:hypothetical protein
VFTLLAAPVILGLLAPRSLPVPPQGTTLGKPQPLSNSSRPTIATYTAAAGQTQHAAAMTANPPTIMVATGAVPRGSRSYSTTDSQGRFVIVVERGSTDQQAAALTLHELDHLNQGDSPSPNGTVTPAQWQTYMCQEARANCNALAGMKTAATENYPFKCSVVTRLQSDAYNEQVGCILGYGVQGPIQSPPCPEVAPGSVPCTP